MTTTLMTWVCYLIKSTTDNRTYIGATPDFKKRLAKHNSGKGAKYTRGVTWEPVVVIAGFESKNACLSFEKHWQKLYKRRNNSRFNGELKYTGTTVKDRILDLFYYWTHLTIDGTHYYYSHHDQGVAPRIHFATWYDWLLADWAEELGVEWPRTLIHERIFS